MKKYISEFIGTFALVFCGTGAVVFNQISGGTVAHMGISFTFGLIVLAMIYSIGDISGAHINPAVTFGFYITKLIGLKDMLCYFIFQITGAIAASFLLYILFPEATTLGETLPSVALWKAFILEIILTFILMFVIIHVATGSKEVGIMAGIAIGGTVALEALFAGPITGASMNPARSLGPALVSGKLDGIGVYLVAPFIGASLAIFTSKYIKGKNCCEDQKI